MTLGWDVFFSKRYQQSMSNGTQGTSAPEDKDGAGDMTGMSGLNISSAVAERETTLENPQGHSTNHDSCEDRTYSMRMCITLRDSLTCPPPEYAWTEDIIYNVIHSQPPTEGSQNTLPGDSLTILWALSSPRGIELALHADAL